MRVKKKNVYYCDFCNKHSLQSLTKHEEYCTLNPQRKCKMCAVASYKDYLLVEGRVAQFLAMLPLHPNSGETTTFTEQQLYADIDGCPACVSSIVRRVVVVGKKKGVTVYFKDVDLRKIFRDFWESYNKENHQYEY